MEQKKTLSAELDHLRQEAYAEEAEHDHEHHHDHDHEHHHDHDHDHEEHDHEHHHHHHHDGHHHADEVFEDFGAETTHKYTQEQIRTALEGLQNIAEVGQVLRAKGIVEGTDGQWIHFDYVPGEPDVRTGSAGTTGMICVIGAGIDQDRIKELFDLK
jgi:G3E family GTPase